MRLANQGPRAVRFKEGYFTNLLLTEVALAAILLAAPFLIDRIGATERELATRGIPVKARATKAELNTLTVPSLTGEKGYDFKGAFEYQVNGITYTGRSSVNVNVLYDLLPKQRKTLTVRYLPERPQISMIEGSELRFERERQTAWGIYVGIIVLLGGATLIWRAMARQERHMLREWAAFPARITKVREIDRGQSKAYEAEVVVTDRDVTEEMRLLLKGEPPKEGEQTFLLQNPEQPNEIRLVNDLKYVEPPRSSAPYP